jgi:hypothetical protein
MAERAELGAFVSGRLRAGGYTGSERHAPRAACERWVPTSAPAIASMKRSAILLARPHVSNGRPSANSAPVTRSRQRGCRPCPSQSSRWLNVGTHKHAGDDLTGHSGGVIGRERTVATPVADQSYNKNQLSGHEDMFTA